MSNVHDSLSNGLITANQKIVCPYCYPFGVSFILPKCPTCGRDAPEHIKKQEGWI